MKNKEKRLLTKREEQIIRLCHHDHGGLSVEDAAQQLHIVVSTVKRHLRRIKHKVPQLFPILTPLHRGILAWYDRGDFELQDEGPHKGEYVWKRPSQKAIAAGLGITCRQLRRRVEWLYKHGFLHDQTMEQYDSSRHDGQIKEVF